MKKIIALLVAGVLSAGVLSFAGCFIRWQKESDKIPQIPQGVVLRDVALDDMESTANKFNAGFAASKNLRTESYRNFKFYIEENGEIRNLEEYETSLSVKYLEENGKAYAESIRRIKNYDKNKYHVYAGTNMEQYRDDENLTESIERYFLKDNYLGMVSDSYKNAGYEIVKLPGYEPPIDEAKEWDEAEDKHLTYLYTNAGDFFSEKGVNVLKQAPYGTPYNLPEIPLEYSSSRGGCGVRPHKRFVETEDPFVLVEPGVNISKDYYLEEYNFVLGNYSFAMQADDTKVYVKQIYTVYFVLKESNLLWATLECAFGYYQDISCNLTANDFQDNYLTDDALVNTYYYDCDKDKVKADFTAGKEVVINPVGGYDTSGININFGEDESPAPYIVFDDGKTKITGFLAGTTVSEQAARVENGKLIIDFSKALEVAKNDAVQRIADSANSDFDFDNAAMFLIIVKPTLTVYLDTNFLIVPLN